MPRRESERDGFYFADLFLRRAVQPSLFVDGKTLPYSCRRRRIVSSSSLVRETERFGHLTRERRAATGLAYCRLAFAGEAKGKGKGGRGVGTTDILSELPMKHASLLSRQHWPVAGNGLQQDLASRSRQGRTLPKRAKAGARRTPVPQPMANDVIEISAHPDIDL